MSESKTPLKARKGSTVVSRLSVALVAASLLLYAAPAAARDFVTVGQTGSVVKAGNGWPCFDSTRSHDDYWASKSNGDRYGMNEALQDAILLRPGWRVRLIGWDSSHSLIRIESGPKAGEKCVIKFNPAGVIQ
jgi:hypothetical protein